MFHMYLFHIQGVQSRIRLKRAVSVGAVVLLAIGVALVEYNGTPRNPFWVETLNPSDSLKEP